MKWKWTAKAYFGLVEESRSRTAPALALALLPTDRKSLSRSLAQVLPLQKWITFPALLLSQECWRIKWGNRCEISLGKNQSTVCKYINNWVCIILYSSLWVKIWDELKILKKAEKKTLLWSSYSFLQRQNKSLETANPLAVMTGKSSCLLYVVPDLFIHKLLKIRWRCILEVGNFTGVSYLVHKNAVFIRGAII